jgi:hypothetical protein
MVVALSAKCAKLGAARQWLISRLLVGLGFDPNIYNRKINHASSSAEFAEFGKKVQFPPVETRSTFVSEASQRPADSKRILALF